MKIKMKQTITKMMSLDELLTDDDDVASWSDQ